MRIQAQRRLLRASPVRTLVTLAAAALATACAGAPKQKEFTPLPERETRAVLAGPLCEGAVCTCREPGDASGAGLPTEPGLKRFEIRIGPVDNELWVKLDDMVLYKTNERASACFYVDLAKGKHPLTLRAAGEEGFAARLAIAELGAHGAYATFEFACGGPGHCDLDQLERWQASLARYQRGAHDPCGSTKIRGIEWQSGKAPDLIHPAELELDLVLDVYEFVPQRAPDDPECAGKY